MNKFIWLHVEAEKVILVNTDHLQYAEPTPDDAIYLSKVWIEGKVPIKVMESTDQIKMLIEGKKLAS